MLALQRHGLSRQRGLLCLRGYYAKEQNKELSGLLDLGSQCFENFNFDYYSSVPAEDLGVSPRTNMERVYDI